MKIRHTNLILQAILLLAISLAAACSAGGGSPARPEPLLSADASPAPVPADASPADASCSIDIIDSDAGLSSDHVTQIVEDADGLIWIGTWNGLNRFDGENIVTVKPAVNDQTAEYSDRIQDVKVASDSLTLWLLIDNRVATLDTRSLSWTDLNSQLSRAVGAASLHIKGMARLVDGNMALRLDDGSWLTMPDSLPLTKVAKTARIDSTRLLPVGNMRIGGLDRIDGRPLIYTARDANGLSRAITKDGSVMVAGPAGDWQESGRVPRSDAMKLYYGTRDRAGNIWLRSPAGAIRIKLSTDAFRRLPLDVPPSMLRTSMIDGNRRVWMSFSDARAVAVADSLPGGPVRFLAPDGSLSPLFVPFGSMVYSMTHDRAGNIWLGTRQSGLIRLRPLDDAAGRYAIEKAGPDLSPVYDLATDSRGRLWIATMGSGIAVCDNPAAPRPAITLLSRDSAWPEAASRVRRLHLGHDGRRCLAATTGGLLDITVDSGSRPRFHLYKTERGHASSLGNVATMDATLIPGGPLLVATESDGVNAGTPGPDSLMRFVSYNRAHGAPDDVALSVTLDSATARAWVVSNREIYALDPATGDTWRAGRRFRPARRLTFNDARPLHNGGGLWLVGLTDGAATVHLASTLTPSHNPSVIFTSAKIGERPDSLLGSASDTITLMPHERDIILRFASPGMSKADGTHFAFRLGHDDWSELGDDRTLTLLNLSPGTTSLSVRASDDTGRYVNDGRTVTLIVTPRFIETPLARVIIGLACAAAIWAVIATVVYIRRLERRQRETLDAYMALLDEHSAQSVLSPALPTDNPPAPDESAPPRPASLQHVDELDDIDRRLLEAISRFVEDNIGNPDVDVDAMAAATAMSRTNLNRKVKKLLGVSPARLIKESRLRRAEQLVRESDLTISDVAQRCGFDDVNYFGKAFKTAFGMPPSAYRRNFPAAQLPPDDSPNGSRDGDK